MNKKHSFILCIFLFSLLSINAQSGKKVIQDTIFRLAGKPIICSIQKDNRLTIDYKFLNDPNMYSIDKKEIEKIKYRTGRIDVINKPAFIDVDETSWEAILITENREDVKGMYSYGEIDATSSPGSPNKKKALYTATIKLQKKAAGLKGNIVLITQKEPRGGYGEPPCYVLKGEVFGYNPPPIEEKNDHKEVINEIIK